ncbi:agmatine deiminase family protein [Coraliomargarita parva]|uniref:agmatine deiminase family protein n=1 Tax=Coraliomargarita parva TaxID=3014050 RepID=UPI0022B5D892|nr:agmatine deiminase family protein [Coraliomargarita parva]
MTRIRKPKELGYRFPAEWEPQEAVWFAWPTREDLWPGVLTQVREQLASLYTLASRFETVRVLCPAHAQPTLLALLDRQPDRGTVELFDYETDDIWCRDFGPIFLLNEDGTECCLTDWKFNAWGDKFPLQSKDNGAPGWIAEKLGIRRFVFDTTVEGGAIESNGRGLILSTEVVLLNPNRNGEISKEEIASRLTAGLGADELLWLNDGLAGDDTDGHIDNLARFFKSDGILIADMDDPQDANYEVLQENIRRIQSFRTSEGRPFASIQLPLPDPVLVDGERVAASYMNFLVLNGGVIVPTYGQPENDAAAMEIIGDCFPGREIVGFDCRQIIHEGGAVHCLSQHQPAVG